MKKLITLFTALLLMLSTSLTACENDNPEKEIKDMKLKVTVGDVVLTATLEDNPTSRDFISLLPLTVKLDDYASSEKIFYPERKLKNQKGSINVSAGDITYYVPWGNIAIFYKDFGRSTDLIKIGRFEGNIDVLKTAGSLDNVKFELLNEQK